MHFSAEFCEPERYLISAELQNIRRINKRKEMNIKNQCPLYVTQGHLVCRTRSDEYELLERHLTAIPEHLGHLKGQFKVFSVEAGSAVRRSDWKKACQFY